MRKTKRKQRKQRAKTIRLSRLYWLCNAREIKEYRETELLLQEGKCAITGVPLNESNAVLDHCHAAGAGSQGRVRGILLSDANMLEGKYLKAFQKMKMDEKYGLGFPTFLINMGEYLLQDNSNKPLHYKFMDDYRSYIKRLTKPVILSKLKSEFGIEVDTKTLHRDLVQIYMQTWVDKIEHNLKEKQNEEEPYQSRANVH